MARQIIEALIDDIDGSTADETVTFGIDGRMYEIDLSYANAAKLREIIDSWAANARKTGRVGSRGGGGARTRTAANGGQVAAVREWAAENGYRVSSRGRISAEVTAAFRAAQAAAPSVKKPDLPSFVEPAKKRGKKTSKKTDA